MQVLIPYMFEHLCSELWSLSGELIKKQKNLKYKNFCEEFNQKLFWKRMNVFKKRTQTVLEFFLKFEQFWGGNSSLETWQSRR
jgi:hypothetical protein